MKVEKGSNKFVFLVLGLFQTIVALLMFVIVTANFIRGENSGKILLLNVFVLFVAFFSLPAGLFSLSYAFGDRLLFIIEDEGITSKKQIIKWSEVSEIEARKFPGPKMSFYKVNIYQNSNGTTKTTLWFSSDINTKWEDILDGLSVYTAKYQIDLT